MSQLGEIASCRFVMLLLAETQLPPDSSHCIPVSSWCTKTAKWDPHEAETDGKKNKNKTLMADNRPNKTFPGAAAWKLDGHIRSMWPSVFPVELAANWAGFSYWSAVKFPPHCSRPTTRRGAGQRPRLSDLWYNPNLCTEWREPPCAVSFSSERALFSVAEMITEMGGRESEPLYNHQRGEESDLWEKQGLQTSSTGCTRTELTGETETWFIISQLIAFSRSKTFSRVLQSSGGGGGVKPAKDKSYS